MRHFIRALVIVLGTMALGTCYGAVHFNPPTAAATVYSAVQGQEPPYVYSILDYQPLEHDSLEAWIQELEACAETTRPADAELMAISARIIVVQIPAWGLDPIDWAAGVWLSPDRNSAGKHVVAIVRHFPFNTDALLKHELLHYVTTLSHPEINPLLEKCVGDVFPEDYEQKDDPH